MQPREGRPLDFYVIMYSNYFMPIKIAGYVEKTMIQYVNKGTSVYQKLKWTQYSQTC